MVELKLDPKPILPPVPVTIDDWAAWIEKQQIPMYDREGFSLAGLADGSDLRFFNVEPPMGDESISAEPPSPAESLETSEVTHPTRRLADNS